MPQNRTSLQAPSTRPVLGECIGCGGHATISVVLARGPHGRDTRDDERLYLPNQTVRQGWDEGWEQPEQTLFCIACMRKVEDNFRATILYLQAENGLVAIRRPDLQTGEGAV